MTEPQTLADLRPLADNPRQHTSENIDLITNALRRVGAARSGVIDEDNVLLAGNGTAQALAEAGITRVRVVEAEGNEWVVVRRSGLTESQKRLLAYFDNRAGDLAGWLAEEIVNDVAGGLNLAQAGVFSAAEVEQFIHEAARASRESYDFLDEPDAPPGTDLAGRRSGPGPPKSAPAAAPAADPPAATPQARRAEGQAATGARFPLAIVLTRQEHAAWQTYKQQVGKADDKAAFLMLLAAVTQEDYSG